MYSVTVLYFMLYRVLLQILFARIHRATSRIANT